MIRTLASRILPCSTRRAFLSTIREPGAVGLSAGDNPRKTLVDLYTETLKAVQGMPETAAYRVNVEKITHYRKRIVEETENVDKIEATLNIGQIQEVIEQAENELELIPHMAEWKPWDLPEGEKPAVINVVD